MAMSYEEKQDLIRGDLQRALAERAAEGYPWVGKYGWSAGLPQIEGATPAQVIDFCWGYATSMSRLCAARIQAEVRRLIPEPILITTDEPTTEYDDEAGCDLSISATAHVLRGGEWVQLEDEWEAQFPGLASDVQDYINKWPELAGAPCIDIDAEFIWEPIDATGADRPSSIVIANQENV